MTLQQMIETEEDSAFESNNLPEENDEITYAERSEWMEKAKKVTLDTLPDFLKSLQEQIPESYGNVCYITAIGSAATAYAYCHEFGLTGFQDSIIFWEWNEAWGVFKSEVGLRMLDYKNMCYPQYEDNFKEISPSTFKSMQIYCQKHLDDYEQDKLNYTNDMKTWISQIQKFIEKHHDYITDPEKYTEILFGTAKELDEQDEKKQSGFEFAPMKPFEHTIHPKVIDHWKSIVAGQVPFGYKLSTEGDN